MCRIVLPEYIRPIRVSSSTAATSLSCCTLRVQASVSPRSSASRYASGVARNAVPHQIASAPSASAATSPRPSTMPPAAIVLVGAIASATCGTSASVPIRPVWPPASVPCATTASTLAAATRRALRVLPTSPITFIPCACASGTIQPGLPSPDANTGTRSSRITSTCLRKYSCVSGGRSGSFDGSGISNSRFRLSTYIRCSAVISISRSSRLPESAIEEGSSRSTPNGLSVSERTLAIISASSSGV